MESKLVIGIGSENYTVNGKEITLTGLQFTPKIEGLAYLYNVTQDKLYYAPAEQLSKASMSGNVITIADTFDDIGVDDILHIQVWMPPLGWDSSIGAFKQIVLNPEHAHYTDPLTLISTTNLAIGKYFKEFTADDFRNLALQINGQDDIGLEIKIYETLDELAAEPATNGTPGSSWIEKTTEIFGAALNGSPIKKLEYIKGQMPEKYLLEYSLQSAINTLDVLIRKF